jgi:HK97 family phage major capsid protein
VLFRSKSALTFPQVTKAGRPHVLAGKPVLDMGRPIDESSELDKAVAGVYAKLLCATGQRGGSKSMGFNALPEHDREILFYAMDKMNWVGSTDGGDYADIKGRRLTPHEQKALIDDSTSGGLEAAPIVFDDQVIQTPLLHGELFPLVNQIPLDRGRRIEGVATGTVTASWGGIDDSAIDLFDTTSYVSAFDTTIYRWQGAFQIGLDFLSDTPIDFGAHVTAQYGERLLEDLDDVIAVGNGTTQPQGVINRAGVTSVSWGGATSIGNYESLRFGVHKREHKGTVASSAVFIGTETSYSRVKALSVGASDARRLFNNQFPVAGYDGYQLMERPYKINESLTNAQIFYAILAKYRMYRRRGLTMRTSQEGDTLIRNNELLMVAMARYGGQLERGAVAAKTTTAPA